MKRGFAIVVGLGATASPALAQHHHHGGGEAAPVRKAWWASVSTVITVGAGHVRDDSTDFVDTTRGYQGAALALAGGWRRLGARLALGGYRVDERGAGLDDLHASATIEVTPRRAPVRAGLAAAVGLPTGGAAAGRGMGHTMMHGGAWARWSWLDGSVGYARALGDGAEHAGHLHGRDDWPLVDPMNAVEVAAELGATCRVVPALALRASAAAALPIDRGARRAVVAGGVRYDRGPLGLGAVLALPVAGDPFVARGQIEIGYRFCRHAAGMRAAAVMFALAAACGGTRPAGEPPIEGLPAIAAPWTTAQLAQAATALDALCTSAPLRLPVYGSRTFERLISAENRGAIVGDTPAARAADHATSTGAILALYGTYLRCGRPVETLAVNAALLEGYAASMPDGDAVIAALPPGSAEAAHKRAGRDQKIAGLRGGIISTVDMLVDPALGPPVPAPLATRLGAAIGQVRAALPDGAIAESLAHLDDAIAAELDPARKQMLATVRDGAR